MTIRSKLLFAFGAALLAQLPYVVNAQDNDHFSTDDYYSVGKVDIHFHIHTENSAFVSLARRDRFRFLNMAVQTGDVKVIKQKQRTTFLQYRTYPDRIAPVSSFLMDGWDETDWQQKTIKFLDETFEKGAIGQKPGRTSVWCFVTRMASW